jgi:hypothetical protein
MFNNVIITGEGVRKEAIADGAIMAGMLVQRTSAGKVKAHATSGGSAQKLFAVEDYLQSKEVTDSYTDGTTVQFNAMRSGDVVQGLWDTTGTAVTVGSYMMSNGAGKLIVTTGTLVEGSIVGVALTVPDSAGRFELEII